MNTKNNVVKTKPVKVKIEKLDDSTSGLSFNDGPKNWDNKLIAIRHEIGVNTGCYKVGKAPICS